MNASDPRFHPGELQAQRAASTSAAAAELSAGLAADLSPYPFAKALFSELQHVWLTAPEGDTGSLWLTPLFGPPGFITAPTDSTLRLRPALRTGEVTPLGLALRPGDPVGLLAIDFATRRRFRLNGSVASVSLQPYTVSLAIAEAFPNCPKYIFRREAHSLELDAAGRDTAPMRAHEDDTTLSPADRAIVTAADTFMLGTAAHGKADANQRGGRPGFVRVLDTRTLLWPDYRGNGMFQSFGNIHSDSTAVALTFLDFRSGALLQLSGRAEIVERDNDPAGLLESVERAAKRGVRFAVASVRRWSASVTSLQWTDIEASHYNPTVLDANRVESPASANAAATDSPFPQPVTLVKIVQETSDIKTFRFLADAPLQFRPGQYATFEFAATETGLAEAVERTWTLSELSNSESGDVTLEVSVKRKEGGLMSTFLHDRAKLGLRATVLGVDGEMTPFAQGRTLDERSRRHGERFCMISGGVGITPNLAILRGLTAENAAADIAFLYQARDTELPFRSEILRRARKSAGGVRLLQAASGETGAEPTEGLCSVHGRLDAARIRQFVPDVHERLVFLCGPTGFMTAVGKALGALGVRPESIISEKFDF